MWYVVHHKLNDINLVTALFSIMYHAYHLILNFRISVLSTLVERERVAFVREVWSALMITDVTQMT